MKTADTIEGFLKPPVFFSSRVFLFGLPGSGVATVTIRLALHYARNLSKEVVVENRDFFHIGKNEQLKTYCYISGIPFVRSELAPPPIASESASVRFVYIRGLKSMKGVESTVASADREGACCCLVLDCTRQDYLNGSLIAEAVRSGVRFAIMTKLDLAPEVGCLIEMIAQSGMSLVMASRGERVPQDGLFVS